MDINGNFTTPVGEIIHARVTVGTTPKLIAIKSKPLRGRRGIGIFLPKESPAATVYVGNRDVSVGVGIPVCSGRGLILPLSSRVGAGIFYMVADTECSVNLVEWTE